MREFSFLGGIWKYIVHVGYTAKFQDANGTVKDAGLAHVYIESKNAFSVNGPQTGLTILLLCEPGIYCQRCTICYYALDLAKASCLHVIITCFDFMPPRVIII